MERDMVDTLMYVTYYFGSSLRWLVWSLVALVLAKAVRALRK